MVVVLASAKGRGKRLLEAAILEISRKMSLARVPKGKLTTDRIHPTLPLPPPHFQVAGLTEFCDGAGMQEITKNFLCVVAENGRLKQSKVGGLVYKLNAAAP
jgi:hypothetical protein